MRIDISVYGRVARFVFHDCYARERRAVVLLARTFVSSRISRSVKVSTGKQGGRQTEPACSRTDSEKRVTDNAVPLQGTASCLHSGEDSKLMHTRQAAHLQPPPSGAYCVSSLTLPPSLLSLLSFSREPRNPRSPSPFARIASGCIGRLA